MADNKLDSTHTHEHTQTTHTHTHTHIRPQHEGRYYIQWPQGTTWGKKVYHQKVEGD